MVKLLDASGTVQASYIYNAWGEVISSTGVYASINPIRYRGYYQDLETGFYYLQSRYYDPVICRFINADSYASTGQGFLGLNMFAYCNNNPVNHVDFSGEFSLKSMWNSIKTWFKQTFSTVSILENKVVSVKRESLTHRIRAGKVTTSASGGDMSKPVVLFAKTTNSRDPFSVGIMFNGKNKGVSFELAGWQTTMNMTIKDVTVSLSNGGILKQSMSLSMNVLDGNTTTGAFQETEFRPYVLQAVGAAVYFGGSIPVIGLARLALSGT